MKTVFGILLGLSLAAPAAAQALLPPAGAGADSLRMDIRFRIPGGCRTTGGGQVSLDPASRDWQPLALPQVQCNFAGSANARFWSGNAGTLGPSGIALGVPGGIPYELRIGDTIIGRPGPAASPAVAPLAPGTADAPRNLQVFIRFTGPLPEAGDFSDTIFMEVTP